MIHLIDLGGEGLATLEGALDRLGFSHGRAASPAAVAAAGPILLPDGGAYDEVAARLKSSGWWRGGAEKNIGRLKKYFNC